MALASVSNMDPLIDELVAARKQQKLTQAALAELAGLSRRALVAIENGGDCTLSTLRRLHTVLGLELISRPFTRPTLEDLLAENEQLYKRPKP